MPNTMPYRTVDTMSAVHKHVLPELALDGRFSIASGTLTPYQMEWVNETLIQGLKVIIVESGELLCRFPQQKELHIAGPAVYTIWNQDQTESAQCFLPGRHLRYTMVSLSLETLNIPMMQDVTAQLMAGMHIDLAARPAMHIQRIPNSLKGLQSV